MYYEKVGLAYGTATGREIQPDYPSSSIDIQPKIDEFRIVGSTGKLLVFQVSRPVTEQSQVKQSPSQPQRQSLDLM